MNQLKEGVQKLRALGKTYTEIQQELGIRIPKSTLSYWCKDIPLPSSYFEKLEELKKLNLSKSLQFAWLVNSEKRKLYLESIREQNIPIVSLIDDNNVAKLFLASLYLGEGQKSTAQRRNFSLGSSDPKIIKLLIGLLKQVFDLQSNKIRCTVQCRADQDTDYLEDYWSKISGIPRDQFYKTRIDPRTIGKPTKNRDYRGVLRVNYFDTRVLLELESLAQLVSDYVEDR